MAHTPARRAAGFTLVEAIATMAILGAVGSVVTGMLYSATKSYTDAAFTAQLQSEANAAMDRIVRELRWINIDANSAPVAPVISSVTPTSIAFNTNWSLSYAGTTISLIENGGAAMALLQNVTSFSLATYDDSNAALATTLNGSTACQPIRRIQIQFTVTRSGKSQTLRSKVYIRGVIDGA